MKTIFKNRKPPFIFCSIACDVWIKDMKSVYYQNEKKTYRQHIDKTRTQKKNFALIGVYSHCHFFFQS